MAELKPCPLCGGKAEFVKLFEAKRYDGFVRCTKCGYEGRGYTSKQNAVKAWNNCVVLRTHTNALGSDGVKVVVKKRADT